MNDTIIFWIKRVVGADTVVFSIYIRHENCSVEPLSSVDLVSRNSEKLIFIKKLKIQNLDPPPPPPPLYSKYFSR